MKKNPYNIKKKKEENLRGTEKKLSDPEVCTGSTEKTPRDLSHF